MALQEGAAALLTSENRRQAIMPVEPGIGVPQRSEVFYAPKWVRMRERVFFNKSAAAERSSIGFGLKCGNRVRSYLIVM